MHWHKINLHQITLNYIKIDKYETKKIEISQISYIPFPSKRNIYIPKLKLRLCKKAIHSIKLFWKIQTYIIKYIKRYKMNIYELWLAVSAYEWLFKANVN